MSAAISGTGTGDRVPSDRRRWRALAVLGLVQFMLVLDVTVVNVALPRIQDGLGFSRVGLAWVVNGYVLMAGGLLLLGGRLADVYGRRRLFLVGVSLFAVASTVCGVAVSPGMLVAGRFVQGTGEAMAAPASLGLIILLFADPAERTKALGIWGGLSGLGGVSGTVISGLLTDLASWRWIFLVNLPVAAFALVMVLRLVSESRMVRDHGRLTFTGAVTGTAGLVAGVYGLLQAAEHPWGSGRVLLPLLGGVVLLAAMLLIEARSPAPLIPLRFFANRTRAVANLVTLFNTSAFFTYVFLLTLFEQQVLGYSPLRGGLSYLPLGVGIGAGVGIGTALMPRLGVRPVISLGFLGAAGGLLLSSHVGVDTSYARGVLPGMFVLGLFLGATLPSTTNAAVHGTTGQDSSLASGVQTTMQQVGGALGLAVLVTFALRHATDRVADGVAPAVATTDGYALAFRVAAGLLAVGGVLAFLLLEKVAVGRRDPESDLTAGAA